MEPAFPATLATPYRESSVLWGQSPIWMSIVPTSTTESASTALRASTRILRVFVSSSTLSARPATPQMEPVSPATPAMFLKLEIASLQIALLRAEIPTAKDSTEMEFAQDATKATIFQPNSPAFAKILSAKPTPLPRTNAIAAMMATLSTLANV